MLDELSLHHHRKDVPITEDTVPIRQVLMDMENPDGGYAAQAAKDYYYLHYASDEERAMIDARNARFNRNICVVLVLLGALVVVLTILKLCNL